MTTFTILDYLVMEIEKHHLNADCRFQGDKQCAVSVWDRADKVSSHIVNLDCEKALSTIADEISGKHWRKF
jgi:hypothetical protein